MKYAAALSASMVVMLALDALWIGFLAKSLYQEGIGHLLAPKANLVAAAAFYLVYIGGIMAFAVLPAAGGGWTKAATLGAGLGFVAYATFDLTSQALLRDWPWKVTLADLVWGTFITATTAAAGRAAFDRV